MSTEHTIICGGIGAANRDPGGGMLPLNLWPGPGREVNVELKIEKLQERLRRTVPPQFDDLLEIAAYVYCADQMVSRGGMDVDTFGAHWRRHFRFHIPVREVDLWRSGPVGVALTELLEFLSDDRYDFEFYPATEAPGIQLYLGLDGGSAGWGEADQVMLFSGGLDSLAGAVDECVVQKRRLVLVNHQSTPKFSVKHRELVGLLTQKAEASAPIHLRVEVNKKGLESKEHTQRARSFLYSAVGATVAMMLGRRGVRFYENGVVSLNLPVCAQVVGSRATRTTHPRVLAGMQRLFTLLAGEAFTVENPFLWETKGEVVGRIVRAGCGAMIGLSRSCAHTWETSNEHTHCGTCSQCIDRRFGVLAAKAEEFDSAGNYKVDIFTEGRPKDEDKIMLAAFLERANQVSKMVEVADLLLGFPDVRRVLPYLGGVDAGRGADRVLDLYRRHAGEVNDGVEAMLGRYTRQLRERTLPGDCLLWTVYAPNSVNVVPAVGVPVVEAGSDGCSDNGAAVLPGPRYLLRRGAGMWRVVFDGNECEIVHGRGISLVAYLLFNPPVGGLHGTELAKLAFGQEIVQEASLGADGDSTRRMIREKAKECMAVVQNPLSSEMEKDEANRELETLAEALNVTRTGSEGSADKQVRAVRRAIDRLIDKLREAKDRKNDPHSALRAFGEHLFERLWKPSSRFSGNRGSRSRAGVAGQFTYERPDGIVWKE